MLKTSKEKSLGNDELGKAFTNKFSNIPFELCTRSSAKIFKKVKTDVDFRMILRLFLLLCTIQRRSSLPHHATLRRYLAKRNFYPVTLDEVLQFFNEMQYSHLKNVGLICYDNK